MPGHIFINHQFVFPLFVQMGPLSTVRFYFENLVTRIWNFGWPSKTTRTPNRKRWQPKRSKFTMTLQQLKHPKKCVFNLLLIYFSFYQIFAAFFCNEINIFCLHFLFFCFKVNLDAETRLLTLTNIQSNNPDLHVFDRAQRRIQHMMERDSYLRFLQSELFLELVRNERCSASTS